MPRPADVRELGSLDEALDVVGDSAFIRLGLGDLGEGTAYRLGGAVALPRRTRLRGAGLLVMGAPRDAGALVAWVVSDGLLPEPPVNVTVARSAARAVDAALADAVGWRVGRATEWDWMAATTEPPVVAGESRLVPLDESHEPEIRELLAEVNPHTDARPFEHPGQVWCGARDDAGRLVACGVMQPDIAGHPLLEGISVHPTHRGTGLGLAVTAYLTRLGVREDGVCTLGMYADNDVARRVYLGLGYGDVHEWSSRRLEQR
jgi:GNAT superfamily N-acetyltransferase